MELRCCALLARYSFHSIETQRPQPLVGQGLPPQEQGGRNTMKTGHKASQEGETEGKRKSAGQTRSRGQSPMEEGQGGGQEDIGRLASHPGVITANRWCGKQR